MATKIQVRRDTAENWTSANTVLSEGEIGYEIDTGFMKIGDGSTAWTTLSYFAPNPVDDNTTYTYSVAQEGNDAIMTLGGSDASSDVVTLVAGTQLTLTVAGDNVTIDVDNDLANYSNATTAFISDITAEAIGSLSDVDVSAVADGSVLSYNVGTGNWEAGAPAVVALNDLSDVDEASPSPGDILTYQAGVGWTGSTSLSSSFSTPGIRLRGTLEKDFNTFGTLTGVDGEVLDHVGNLGNGPNFYHPDTNFNFIANLDNCFLNAGTFGKFTIMVNNEAEGRSSICTNIRVNGFAPNLQWVNGEAPVRGTPGEVDIIEITVFNNGSNLLSNLTEPSVNADVYVWAHHLTQDIKLDGDLTGSVFGDDSTLLVDGVNNTIPAANLSGALPAIDGSNLLNIGVGENITAVVEDTTPQLGGNLDLNSADITGEGNIDITGNIANTGNTTVTGTLKVDSGNNIVIEKTVSGNNETFGNIIATTGTTEYAKIEFKTGADGFADNSEINWFSRVGGSSVQIFEIKGSSLGKSGFEINPGANLNVDFFMQGAADPTLIFADAGLDKVGFGKIPTQGKVDVDGDIYATTIRGTIVATAGSAPAAGSDPGDEGEIRFDNDYIYLKTPGGSWKRVALSSIV